MAAEAPAGWKHRPLLECVKTIGGGTPSRNVLQYFEGSIPWLTVTDMPPESGVLKTITSARQAITKEALESSAAKIIPPGAVLFTTRVAVGKVAIAGRELTTNQDFTSFVPVGDLDPRFLGYHLLSTRSHLESIARGATVRGLPRRILESLTVPIPPLDEQRRIVTRIEELLKQIEAAKSLHQASSDEAGQLFYSSLQHVFGSINSPPRRLGDITVVTSGATPSRSRKEYYGGSVPWVKSSELHDGIIERTEEAITKKALEETNVKLFPPGTLLIALYGQGQTRGRTGVLAVGAATNQACAAILPAQDSEPFFLQYWFMYQYSQIRASSEARGGTQPNLNGIMIKNLRLPLPPFGEQRQIVDYLNGVQTKVTKLRSLQVGVSEVLDAFNHAILDHAVSGRL